MSGFGPASRTGGTTPFAAAEDLAGIIRFLSQPGSYPVRPPSVAVLETHMSLVFLAGDLVYKMKRPVRLPFVDYTTLEARRLNCEREVTLNQRLAPGVYLGAIPLLRRADGSLSLVGSGAPVEWLVVIAGSIATGFWTAWPPGAKPLRPESTGFATFWRNSTPKPALSEFRRPSSSTGGGATLSGSRRRSPFRNGVCRDGW